jgi:hypothetical protein
MDHNPKTKVEVTTFGANGEKDVAARSLVLGKALKHVLNGRKSGTIGRFIIELPDGTTITNSDQAAALMRAIA